ncbi:MAG: hypothetical protein CL912_08390 [Deltaproteobacteria bacterium]|nr:hypothetical protein [Deltaproteobacteria bacterium]
MLGSAIATLWVSLVKHVKVTIATGFEWGDYETLQAPLYFLSQQPAIPVAAITFGKSENGKSISHDGLTHILDRINVDCYRDSILNAPFTIKSLQIGKYTD